MTTESGAADHKAFAEVAFHLRVAKPCAELVQTRKAMFNLFERRRSLVPWHILEQFRDPCIRMS